MSRILRRPMFRGGQVIDSRGTGITSGLMDGGRVGYNQGNIVLGSDLLKKANLPTDFSNLNKLKFSAAMPFPYKSGAADKTIKEKVEDEVEKPSNVMEGSVIDKFDATKEADQIGSDVLDSDFATTEKITLPDGTTKQVTKPQEDLSPLVKLNLGIIDREQYNAEMEKINAEKAAKQEKDTKATVLVDDKELEDLKNVNNNQEQSTELSAKEMVAENKKLFAEMLGMDKARSSDIGDMLLRFAAAPGSTTQEKFQTYLQAESQAGKGRAEKINETAAALAINDYVAGKRSKEQIKQLKEVATFKDSLGNKFTENLIKIAGPGTIPNASHIESALRTSFPGKNVTRYNSKDKVKTTAADTGTFLLEEDTKRAFLIVDGTTGKKKQVY